MHRSIACLFSVSMLLVALSSGSTEARDWPGSGFLGGLTSEQKAQLKEIGAEFMEETREYAPAMKEAGEKFFAALKAQWEALTDEQKTKATEFTGKMRSLPRSERFTMAMKLLGSVNMPAVATDVTAMLEAETAEARVAAGEKLLWHAAGVIGSILETEVGLSKEQLESLGGEMRKMLDSTRENRVAIQRIVDTKLQAAAEVLTEEQLEKIEKIKQRVLSFCEGMSSMAG